MALRDPVRSIQRLLECAPSNTGNSDLNADFFVKNGCEYYATAGFAMYAQRSLICGNLFHHAVEMLLKAGLAIRAKTSPVWRSRGTGSKSFGGLTRPSTRTRLQRYDKTISRLEHGRSKRGERHITRNY